MASLKKIVDEMRTLCTAHDEVRTFEYGEVLQIIKSNSVEYTGVFMNCNQSNYDPNQNKTTLVIDLLVMDRVFKGWSNVLDVENQTHLIVQDLIGVIWHAPVWQQYGVIRSISPAVKFRDRTADLVTGWGVTINFELVHDYGYCDVPINGYTYTE